MRIRLLLPIVTLTALLGFSASGVRAGSFFGPECYGARFTNRYPNRSHNVFGCGPDCRCSAWHGFCRHRLIRRHRGVPNEGMAVNAMPGYAMPVNGMPLNVMPVNGMPVTGVSNEYMHGQMPLTQLPMAPAPVRMTSGAPAPVVATPAVQSRIVPVPAPMPSGPATAEPPQVDASGKPPF